MPDLRSAAALSVPGNEFQMNFAEVGAVIRSRTGDPAVTIHMGNTEVEIRDGADMAIVETVLRILWGKC